jgi:hypothetical protein
MVAPVAMAATDCHSVAVGAEAAAVPVATAPS